MKVSAQGIAALLCIIIPSVTWYISVNMWEVLICITLKYTFGEGVAKYVYMINNNGHDFLMHMYMTMVAFVMECVLRTKVHYTIVDEAGQEHLDSHYLHPSTHQPDLSKLLTPPRKGKAKLIIMNHHTRVDWLYLFIFFTRSPRLAPTVRIVLKEQLRKIPIVGWGMEQFRYLFLSRSWEKDEIYLRDMVQFYHDTNDNVSVFIFPEGTDLSASNIEKSNAYAAKNGLPEFHHVLTPRVTGSVALKNLLGEDNLEEVIDFTIGYTYSAPGRRPDEASLVDGGHARAVHLVAQVFRFEKASPSSSTSVSVAPAGDAPFTQFLHDRFAVKEQLLSRFYLTSPNGFTPTDLKAVLGSHFGVKSYDGFKNTPVVLHTIQQVTPMITLFAVLFWFPVIIYSLTHITLVNVILCASGFAVMWQLAKLGRFQELMMIYKVPEDKTLVSILRKS